MEKLSYSNYVCVSCGSKVNTLYKEYSPSVLKLTNCETCAKEADKYIEYDSVIILIDLILFKREAYRHIIYNSEFKNHWKLVILVLLMKTYNEWATHYSSSEPHRLGPLILEQTFYRSFLLTAAGSAVYAAFVLVVACSNEVKRLRIFPVVHIKNTWKALISSNFGQFLLLPSLIWTDLQKPIHIVFVTAYCLLSQMQAISVVSAIPRPVILILLLIALCIEQAVTASGRDCKTILQ